MCHQKVSKHDQEKSQPLTAEKLWYHWFLYVSRRLTEQYGLSRNRSHLIMNCYYSMLHDAGHTEIFNEINMPFQVLAKYNKQNVF